jgi:hypothetical protein
MLMATPLVPARPTSLAGRPEEEVERTRFGGLASTYRSALESILAPCR